MSESATKFCRISALGESNNGNFRPATKAERQGDGTDAPIHIELHSIAQPEQPVHIFGPHIRKKQRRQQGEKNLSAVGMSGEYEVNPPVDGIIREIRLVCQQDYRFVFGPARWKGSAQIGLILKHILDPGEPDPLATSLQGHEAVGQHGNAVGMQGIGNRVRPYQAVVVT